MEPIVCIIDDDLVSQFATRYTIEQSNKNCRVTSFDNAEEALESFKESLLTQKELPTILLLDLVMPVMDGWTMMEEIEKLLGHECHMQVYILSAFQNSKDRIHAKEHPMVRGFFDKPLSKNNLDIIFESRTV
jgi:CheY-like chemotaxis protein